MFGIRQRARRLLAEWDQLAVATSKGRRRGTVLARQEGSREVAPSEPSRAIRSPARARIRTDTHRQAQAQARKSNGSGSQVR